MEKYLCQHYVIILQPISKVVSITSLNEIIFISVSPTKAVRIILRCSCWNFLILICYLCSAFVSFFKNAETFFSKTLKE